MTNFTTPSLYRAVGPIQGQRRRASTILVVMVASSFFLLLLIALSSFAYLVSRQTIRATFQNQAVALGNGGLNRALAKYRVNPGYTGESYSLATGDLDTFVTALGPNKIITARIYVPGKADPNRLCSSYQAILDPTTKQLIKKTYVEVNEPDCGLQVSPQPSGSSTGSVSPSPTPSTSIAPTISGGGTDCDVVTIKGAVLPAGNADMSAVTVPTTGKIYLIGGYKNKIVEYNPSADTAIYKNATNSSPPGGARGYWNGNTAAYASSTGKIYIFGGDGGLAVSDNIFSYDPATDSLALVAHMPGGRTWASAAYDPASSKIYVFGGSDAYGPLNEILEFNPASNSVAKKSATTGLGRRSGGAVYSPVTSKIYYFGGDRMYPNGWDTDEILEYTPGTDTIVTKGAKLPSANSKLAAVWDATRNRAFIFSNGRAIWEYNPATDGVRITTASYPSQRAYVAAAWSASTNQSYIFGGSVVNVGLLNQILAFSNGPCSAPSPSPSNSSGLGGGTGAENLIRYRMDLGIHNANVNFNANHQARLYRYTNNQASVVKSIASDGAVQEAGGAWHIDFNNIFGAGVPAGTYCAELDFNFKIGSSSAVTYPEQSYLSYSNAESVSGVAGPFDYTTGLTVANSTGSFGSKTNQSTLRCPAAIH